MQKDLHRQESHKAESQHPHSHLLTGGSDAICNWILRLLNVFVSFSFVYIPYFSMVLVDFNH